VSVLSAPVDVDVRCLRVDRVGGFMGAQVVFIGPANNVEYARVGTQSCDGDVNVGG